MIPQDMEHSSFLFMEVEANGRDVQLSAYTLPVSSTGAAGS